MSATKWIPEHWRHGCWVRAHTRSNGVHVKQHWRAGSRVRAHDASNNPTLPAPGNPRQPPPQTRRRNTAWPNRSRPNHATPVVVTPTPNNAAMALALTSLTQLQVQPKASPGTPHATATLQAVIYTDHQRARCRYDGITTAMAAVILPPHVIQVTIECLLTTPDDTASTLRIDVPFFLNADHTITTTDNLDADPEVINRIVDRLSQKGANAMQLTQRRNHVRSKLGAANPEIAVRHAIADILQLAPPPPLKISQPITIPCPGTDYAITIHPMPDHI